MPEAATMDATKQTDSTTTTSTTDTTSLGWRAGLPDDLKQNTDLVNYKTVGDFTKDALSWKAKSSELETKLGDYVPKLPDDATDADKALYYDALGRPKTAAEYKLDGEDKTDPKSVSSWKEKFYKHGLTQDQANGILMEYKADVNEQVKAYEAKTQQEISASKQALMAKWGDKFDTNVELTNRLWKNFDGKKNFDEAFADLPFVNKWVIMDSLVYFASKTGEDRSPQGTGPQATKGAGTFIAYDKSPKPPQKR